MESLIILVILISSFVYLMIKIKVDDQKDGTKSEKVGKAIGELAHDTANFVSNTAFRFTEPSNKKKIRLAKQTIAIKNHLIYAQRCIEWSDLYKKKLFTIDDSLKSALDLLNIQENTWKRAAEKLLYIGILKRQAYNGNHEKHNKHFRECQIKDGTTINGRYSHLFLPLIEALNFYKIPYQEWIDYGDVVIAMHNLLDDDDLDICGYI